jgi:septal ring factor EnvC (AmiA/AmiB activator)
MKFPLVSRKRLEAAKSEVAVLRPAFNDAMNHIEELEHELAALTAPEEALKRDIAEVEAKITLAETQERMRKINEEPDPDRNRPERPSMECVKRVAAKHRANRVPRKT